METPQGKGKNDPLAWEKTVNRNFYSESSNINLEGKT